MSETGGAAATPAPPGSYAYGNELEASNGNHIQCCHAFLVSETAADYIPLLQQELEQAQRYHGDEQEDEDNDDNEVPRREEEPEEWMLLCRLNQQYDHDIWQGSQSHGNPQFDWKETARAVPPGLLQESRKLDHKTQK